MDTKISGYLLLILGVVGMCLAALQVYFTFTGSATPVAVVHTSGMQMTLPAVAGSSPGSMELISSTDLDQITNLTLTYLLLTFLVSLGYRIASLGVQLLRPVEVKLNQKSAPPPATAG